MGECQKAGCSILPGSACPGRRDCLDRVRQIDGGSKAERALFTVRRKQAYEALYPETKPTSEGGGGRNNATRRQLGDDIADRFTADTAAKTGQSERAVQRDAERGTKISERALSMLKGTPLDTGKAQKTAFRFFSVGPRGLSIWPELSPSPIYPKSSREREPLPA